MTQAMLRCVAGMIRARLALIQVTILAAGFGLAVPCWSAGTPAATVIDNVAQVNFEIAGTPITQNSNVSSITVQERIDVVVVLQSPQVLVAANDTDRALLLTVTNTVSVFKQMEQMFGQAKRVFCSSFSCYAACR